MTAAEPCVEFSHGMSDGSFKENDVKLQNSDNFESKSVNGDFNCSEKLDSEVNTSNCDKSAEKSFSSEKTLVNDIKEKADEIKDNDRERSSSPEIIHIRTVPATPTAVKPTEEELKKRFEIAYLDNVLFKIHQLLKQHLESSSSAESKTQEGEVGLEDGANLPNETEIGETSGTSELGETSKSNPTPPPVLEEKSAEKTTTHDKPESSSKVTDNTESCQEEPTRKKQKLSEADDSDEEIKAICTINLPPFIPGFTPALESKFCDLWDLSNQKPVAQFMYEKSCFNPLKEIVMQSMGPLKEISTGILANMCTISDVCKCVTESTDLVEHMTDSVGNTDFSPDVHSQMLKLFSYCLQRDEDKWVGFLKSKNVAGKCFEMLRNGKKYAVEKIVDNLMFILDISEGMKTSLCEKDEVVQSVCKAISNYGVNTKEESSIETVSCLLSILSQVEACNEVAACLFYPHSKLLLDTFDSIIVSLDQNELLFFYKQVLARLLNLSKYIYAKFSVEEKLETLHRYSTSSVLVVEFLDSFEQEAEELESDVDNFSWHYNYQVLSECYHFYRFVEKVKNEVGEEKFFQGFSEQDCEALKIAFESYAKNENYSCDDEQSDESDIVEIPQSQSSQNSQSNEVSASDNNEYGSKTTSNISNLNDKEKQPDSAVIEDVGDQEPKAAEEIELKEEIRNENNNKDPNEDSPGMRTDDEKVDELSKSETSVQEDMQGDNPTELTKTEEIYSEKTEDKTGLTESAQISEVSPICKTDTSSKKEASEAYNCADGEKSNSQAASEQDDDDGFGSPPPDDLSDTDL